MHDNRTHPLLEQVPLTVSPFIHLPTATTLPYTYKAMPSTLPPSASGITSTSDGSDGGGASSSSAAKHKYIVSPSGGHAAHPDDIVASCRALQAHVARMQADADAELRALAERAAARELAEKRRLAPGWLDSDARLLEPERVASASSSVVEPSAAPPFGDVGEFDGAAGAEAVAAGGFSAQFASLQIGGGAGGGGVAGQHGHGGEVEMAVPDEAEELDRAFGAIGMGSRR